MTYRLTNAVASAVITIMLFTGVVLIMPVGA